MKKFTQTVRVFASILLMGCAFSFASCSDDDENTPMPPTEVNTDMMFGNYDGKMVDLSIQPTDGDETGDGNDALAGVDVSATFDNDSIYFEDFPVRNIVLSIVNDGTTADQIVAALGTVSYKVGYKPAVTAGKDSIAFVLDPEPLTFSVTLPSVSGEEAQPLTVQVKVETMNTGGYSVETGNAKFDLAVTEVLLGEGDAQAPLEGFHGIGLNFDMNQHKTFPHSF